MLWLHLSMQILLYLYLLVFSSPSISAPEKLPVIPQDSLELLYKTCGLENQVSFPLFKKTVEGYLKFHPRKSILAIADLSLPSDQKRLFIIDLKGRKLLQSTWVAHGKNSGLKMATRFSNEPRSYQTSPGFYRVGNQIFSPKHGLALMLDGLEKGVNDNARKREIILHGADYVGESFIKKHGRCGRSHGCPAVPPEIIKQLAPVLVNGSLLYIHTAESF